jgi:hypothetical protein
MGEKRELHTSHSTTLRSKVGKNLFRVGVWAGRKPQKIGKESKRRKNARKKKKTMKKSASGTHM